jgi:hypothetical protein
VSLLGCACGVSPVPLVPQEVARLPLQSPYVKGEEGKIAFKSNNLLEKNPGYSSNNGGLLTSLFYKF